MDEKSNKVKKYNFYFRCLCCNAALTRTSHKVKDGIQESPYCSKCSSFSFDTSPEKEYHHQSVSDGFMSPQVRYEE